MYLFDKPEGTALLVMSDNTDIIVEDYSIIMDINGIPLAVRTDKGHLINWQHVVGIFVHDVPCDHEEVPTVKLDPGFIERGIVKLPYAGRCPRDPEGMHYYQEGGICMYCGASDSV